MIKNCNGFLSDIKFLLFFALLFFNITAKAQTLPVGLLENVEDSYRRNQLLGLDLSNSSYMIRPIHLSALNKFNTSLNKDRDFSIQELYKSLYSSKNEKLALYAMPITWQQQINTHHPYGMNDGSMIQSKGYQTQISAGLYFKAGPLSIQLRPEFVFAQNSDFELIEENDNDAAFQEVYANLVYNRIDNPAKFNDGHYQKMDWGQSSIRLNFDPISFGLSNENLWWGPGVRNSLLMSNNASGFKHLTLNTTRPVDIYIGKIEAQIIAARLEQSGVSLPQSKLYTKKPNDWRYLSGVSFNYQPKWIPGLFLGFSRTFMVYHKDMGNLIGDYIPIFNKISKDNYYDKLTTDDAEDNARRDQYFSAFARWVMPESKMEIYLEYGRNDHAFNLRDYIIEPEHSRAYIAGFRKLVPLNKLDEYIQIGFELTQLESPRVDIIRVGPVWYSHHQVTAGYTNNGQVLGAGIGPGSNMQSLDVSWVKKLKTIGFGVERIVHNNDFFYNAGAPISDVRRHWIDYAFKGKFAWDFKRFVFNSELTYIKSLNYQWRLADNGNFFWDWPKKDVNNLHAKIGVLYHF